VYDIMIFPPNNLNRMFNTAFPSFKIGTSALQFVPV